MMTDYEYLQEFRNDRNLRQKIEKAKKYSLRENTFFSWANGTPRFPNRPRPSLLAEENRKMMLIEIEDGDTKGRKKISFEALRPR